MDIQRALTSSVCAAALAFANNVAFAQSSTPTPSTPHDLRVTITNEGSSSFSVTPLWFGLHDGGFDLYDAGAAPSAGLELLAEDGDPSVLISEFDGSVASGDQQGVVFAPDGFEGAPVVEPNETGVAYLTPTSPADYRYFTFASMVIPSNDTFVGNGDPLAYQVFTPDGEINDPSGVFTIELFGGDLRDSGTELNNAMGAAFSTLGGSPTDTTDGIGPAGDLMEFLDSTTPSGVTITDFIDADELVATITVSQIPEPATATLALLALVALPARRRAH